MPQISKCKKVFSTSKILKSPFNPPLEKGEKPQKFTWNYLNTILVLFIILLAPHKSIFAMTNEPLVNSEWVYFALEKLETAGFARSFFLSKPLGREEIARIVSDIKGQIADGRIKPNIYEEQLIKKLEAEFVVNQASERKFGYRGSLTGWGDRQDYGASDNKIFDEYSLALRASAAYHPHRNVTLYEELSIDREVEKEGDQGDTASTRLREWKLGYTADFQKGYLLYHLSFKKPEVISEGQFEALLGRQSLFWGPGYSGSLILSDNSPPFDMIFASAKLSNFKFMTFSTQLDMMWHEHGSADSIYDPLYRYLATRYLSAHRIDWSVNKKLEVALSEAILYGGETRNMELRYINPIMPYYANEYNSYLDDNVMICFDIVLKPVKRLKLYGQLLIDDYSYEKVFRYAEWDPNALGYLAGIYVNSPPYARKCDFRAEYTHIDTWAYSHRVDENQYTHYGWVIGHSLGPDARQIFFEIRRIITADIYLKLNYTYRQWGRSKAYRSPGEGYKETTFPSEPVTSQSTFGAQVLWETIRGPQVKVSWQKIGIDPPYESDEASIKGTFYVRIGYLF